MPVKAPHRELGTPLCLAFGKTCDSPTVETYSLYGIVDGCPCLHSESPDLDRVLNALQQPGWDHVAGDYRRDWIARRVSDEHSRDNFFIRDGSMTKLCGIILLPPTHLHLERVVNLWAGDDEYKVTWRHPCLCECDEIGSPVKDISAVKCDANLTLDLLEHLLLPRHWAAVAQELKLNPGVIHLPKCPSGAAAPSKAVTRGSPCKGSAIGHMKAMEELLRPLAYQGGKCVPRALMMGIKLASEELSSRSGSRGGASASSAGWCCNSRAIARGNCRACVAARAFL